jgi:hypothetical protein
MATYYKYAERSADSQVNWAEVGKGISDMLKEETTIREQKKAAIDQATREFQKTLENAPQGQFQDANKFTNDYAHSMMEQQMIDNRLLKSGQMKLQDFTYRRQNYVDGTNTLFDLQKLYQDNYKKKMEGIQSGELQALTGANMASVEGFADFSKSKAVIDPTTGVVNVGIMRPNATTGVLELTNDVAPVNVIKGKILADIPAWKADEVMNNTVKNLGESMDYIYQAATKTGAGTVTKLLGIGALQGEVGKHPEFKDSIDKANSAINSTIDSYFANDYNISSVLTQNTGKYSQESFTYDKNLAAKDKSKILLKINTSSGLPIIDKSGAHYKEQETEAREWVRTQLLGKIDDKRELDVTGTIPYGPQPQQWQYQAGADKQIFKDEGNFISKLYSGDDQEVAAAVNHFNGLSNVNKVVRNPNGIVITFKDGTSKPFNFTQNGAAISHDDFVRGASKLLLGDNADIKAVLSGAIGGKLGKQFNSSASASAEAITPTKADPRGSYNAAITSAPVSTEATEGDAVVDLTGKFGNFGFQFEETGAGFDEVKITAPNGKTTVIPFDNKKGSKDDINATKALKAFLIGNMTDEELIKAFPQGSGGNTNQAPR